MVIRKTQRGETLRDLQAVIRAGAARQRAARAAAGQGKEPKDSYERRANFVEGNLGLVHTIARQQGRPEEIDDLIQEGSLGLVEARRQWDPKRGVPLGSFAAWAIRGRILKHLRKVDGGPSRGERDLFYGFDKKLERARAAQGTKGDLIAALAKQEKMTVGAVRSTVAKRAPHVSLESTDPRWLERRIASVPPEAETALGHAELNALVEGVLAQVAKGLRPVERAILRERLLCDEDRGRSLKTLGRRYGVSAERVRQLEVRLREQLQAVLTKAGITPTFLKD